MPGSFSTPGVSDARLLAVESSNAGKLDKSGNLVDVASTGATRANIRVPVLLPAACVATANVALTGLQTIDGYTLVDGDQALLTAQTTASQNGPWVAHSGAWTRPTDFPSGAVLKARTITIITGTAVNAGTVSRNWLLQANTSITVDTSAQTWVPSSTIDVSKAPLNALGRFTVMPEIKSATGGVVRMRSATDGLLHQWDLTHDGISGNFAHLTTGPNTLAPRTVTDAATTSGSPTVTSATAAFYNGNDRPDAGKLVTGPGIPANACVGTVVNATTITLVDYTTGLPVNATATATGVTLTFGAGPNPNGCVFAIGVTGATGILINNYSEGSGISLVQQPLVAATSSVMNVQQMSAGPAIKGIYSGATGSAPLIRLAGANAVAGTAMMDFYDQTGSGAVQKAGQIMADTGLLDWHRSIQAVAPSSIVTPIIRVADEGAANATEAYLSAKTTAEHGLIIKRFSGSSGLFYDYKWAVNPSDGSRLRLEVLNGAKAVGDGTRAFATMIEVRSTATPAMAFFGATPVVQPSATTDLRVALINLGLLASGGASPLDLNGGSLTAAGASFTGHVVAENNIIFRGKESGGTVRNLAYVSSGNVVRLGDDAAATTQVGGTQIWMAPGGVVKTTFSSNGLVMADAVNILTGTATGSKIASVATQKLGFWGATPVVQPAAITQTYATATRTVANPTASAVATTAATNSTPFGFTTQAQADAIVAAVNALIADVANNKQVLNALIDDHQLIGLCT